MRKKKKSNAGRKSTITKDVLVKLEDGFSNSLSDEQACAYAGVSPDALYRYQKKHETFRKQKEALKLRPDIKAKKTIVDNLGDPSIAWRWLERRDPDFKPISKIEHSVEVRNLTLEMSDEERKALAILRAARRKRIEIESDNQI